MIFSRVLFILGLLFSSGESTRFVGNSLDAMYDIEVPDIYSVPKQEILSCTDGSLVFNSSSELPIRSLVTTTNGFSGQIIEIKNNTFIAQKIPMTELIEKGKIQIGKGISVPFCVGFNTDKSGSCLPRGSFPLFSNQVLSVDCDNCYLGLSSTIFVDIEFEYFRLKQVSAGFKNAKLVGGMGVNIQASEKWSYLYDKTEKLIDHFSLASLHIGPISINIWIDVPAEIFLSAFASMNGQLRLGYNLNAGLGDTFFVYTPKDGFKFSKPSLVPEINHYIETKSLGTGQAVFRIVPSIKLFINDIFEMTTRIVPELDGQLSAETGGKICIASQYSIMSDLSGNVLSYPVGPIKIFDTGVRPIEKTCK